MSVSLVGNPSNLTPVYNPVFFYFDSTNKNLQGFRYIVEIWNSDTNTFIDEQFEAPRIGDGYGVANIGRILKTQLEGDLELSSTTVIHANDSYINYELRIGESYIANPWEYSDYEFYTNSASTFNAYTQLRNFNTATTHTYVVGDQINVVQSDGGALKPLLSGLQTIVEVPNNYTIVINIPFFTIGAGATVSGSTTYADKRKINNRNLLYVTGNTAFNGAVAHIEFPSWNPSAYTVSTNFVGDFLTTSPTIYTILEDSSVYLNAYSSGMSQVQYAYYENSNGDIFAQSLSAVTNSLTGHSIIQIAAADNANPTIVISGSTTLIKTNTEWIEVSLTDASFNKISQTRRYNINRMCRINDYEIMFKDRLGSYLVFPAILRATINNNVQRGTYKSYLGDLSGGKWTYNSKDRGEKVFNVDVDESYSLNTPFMTADESLYFKELISSSDVYIKLNGEYWAANIVDGSVELKTPQNNRLIKYGFQLKLSNNNVVNY